MTNTLVENQTTRERRASVPLPAPSSGALKALPRVGFLGVGWIGLKRMEAIARAEIAEIAAIADVSAETLDRARPLARSATLCHSLEELFELELDGVVIATPSALHADQTIDALNRGLAVFCQKPLARTAAETVRVVETARKNDRLLGLDLSYRFMQGAGVLRDLIQNGDLGRIFAAELTFHNAYGPDKAWFYDARLSGGGCVIDLGIHLVDLALWCLAFPKVERVTSRLVDRAEPLPPGGQAVEDFATAMLDLENGPTLQLTCSWNLPAGSDAVISAAFYGTKGGARIRNINGSFYDFITERLRGTRSETLISPPEDWGGRAALDWARRLAQSNRYDPEIEELISVAATLDQIYGR